MNNIYIAFCILLIKAYSYQSSLGKGPTSFWKTLNDITGGLQDVMQMYGTGQNINASFLPEIENSTTISTGLPGTRFQQIIDQNIADICIPTIRCNRTSLYRTINGSCNNLLFPQWGLTGTALVRLIPALYQDGLHQPRMSVTGRPLPDVRYLRNGLLPNKNTPDHINTLIVMEWGQIISHDTTHISVLPAQCMPIQVPANDPYFNRFNQTCLNFIRSVTTTDYGCSLTPQQQLAMVTHFVDASFIYGSTDYIANLIRNGTGGKLAVQRTPDGRIFPPNVPNATHYCDVSMDTETCYLAGDSRVNQNTDVSIIHIVFLREHNKLCTELLALNPHWDDERLYQEARRIVVAAVQRITYTDFLIVMLGRNYSSRNRISDYDFDELYDGYETLLNPTSINDFTAAAFRAFHNLIPSTMELIKESRCPFTSLFVSDWFFRPSIIQQPGFLDGFIRGLTTQRSLKFNNFFSEQITDKLFRLEAPYGSDLAAIDIQRGRDHGLPPYNEYRVACGLPRAANFSDFSDVISSENINLLAEYYASVDDVEFYVAGLMENHVDGALTGPTFQCILGEQFVRWRNGDRFYYQFSDQAGSFTPAQYEQLQKLRLSLIFCRNGDNIINMQPNVFYRPISSNQLVPCSELPQLDLTPWKESP
ncbi:peroxidase isoform X2 [Halyomorpha halys]|uniref:peroxidase isoform X2 n=1 Tax=Halyomorpha halys TaxID=286706 RepID=UPI0006D4D227|nr:peroxidase isoform X2 [Halyomorpha halys]